jgi:transcription initiation factor IIE alpha subunit
MRQLNLFYTDDTYQELRDNISNTMNKVFLGLTSYKGGATSTELSNHISMSRYTLRPLLTALQEIGLVVKTEKLRPNEGGFSEHVWQLTPLGRKEASANDNHSL